jgi:hypothetical protein
MGKEVLVLALVVQLTERIPYHGIRLAERWRIGMLTWFLATCPLPGIKPLDFGREVLVTHIIG